MSIPSDHEKSTIGVMLVDDSAVIRGALSSLLEEDPQIKIAASISNGEQAINAAERHKPDIIILDIEMPVMDGITALPKILEKSPQSKVIMFSTLTERGAAITIKALSLGAVECLVKPGPGEARKGSPFQSQLISLIKNLAPRKSASPPPQTSADNVAVKYPLPSKSLLSSPYQLKPQTNTFPGRPDLIAIGSSTGGPQALFQVMKHLKGLKVPIIITQHMPATFTKILAEHITQNSGIDCREGQDDMPLEAGKAYLAPGGFHMLIERKGTQVVIKINNGPPENFCKPAVDPMMRSAIEVYRQKILGVILTGMGQDGVLGCKALADIGGSIIAQDEASSVVWGMPRAVAIAGICSAVLPLPDIGPWIKKAVI
jgi:two-component system chemotaxis response regulator CheB